MKKNPDFYYWKANFYLFTRIFWLLFEYINTYIGSFASPIISKAANHDNMKIGRPNPSISVKNEGSKNSWKYKVQKLAFCIKNSNVFVWNGWNQRTCGNKGFSSFSPKFLLYLRIYQSGVCKGNAPLKNHHI